MTETIDEFRLRARAWLATNLAPISSADPIDPEVDSGADWAQARRQQKVLHEGGFAGMCYPVEYGGQGLAIEYQRAFNEEAEGYDLPVRINYPTLTICGPTLLDTGTEEQKREFLPKAITGELLFCQFLSEPSGGSDLAGVLTRADRVDGGWLLNGSKTWSSAADTADWALILARTNWDVPKHRGLTLFLMKIQQPGVRVHRIQMVDGSHEFCEEFIDDVLVPDSAVIGEVDGGWSVVNRLLYHERAAMGGGSPFVCGTRMSEASKHQPSLTLSELASSLGVSDQEWALDLIGHNDVMHLVHEALVERVGGLIQEGALPPTAISFVRLFHAEAQQAERDHGLELAGSAGVTSGAGDPAGHWAVHYLSRQGVSLGGGSTEMARNVIAERVLGMPREPAPDKDTPFREVRHGSANRV